MLGPLLWVSMAQSWGEEALRPTVQHSSLQNSVSGENYSLLLADLTYISIYCTLRGVLPLNYDLFPEGSVGVQAVRTAPADCWISQGICPLTLRGACRGIMAEVLFMKTTVLRRDKCHFGLYQWMPGTVETLSSLLMFPLPKACHLTKRQLLLLDLTRPLWP